MNIIFKYLVAFNKFSIDMPEAAEILCVQVQEHRDATGELGDPVAVPYLWAITDPSKPAVKRNFYLVGTGDPLEVPLNRLQYIGTFILHQGTRVHHLFEVT